MQDRVATFAGEYGKCDTIVAHAAVLAAHDAFHADPVAAIFGLERHGVAVAAVQPFRMLAVWKTDPRHVTRVSHDHVIGPLAHLSASRDAGARLDQSPRQGAYPVDIAEAVRREMLHRACRCLQYSEAFPGSVVDRGFTTETRFVSDSRHRGSDGVLSALGCCAA